MNQSVEGRVVDKFREHLARGDLTKIRFINRVAGGMPGEGDIEEEFIVSGNKTAAVRAKAAGAPSEEAFSELDVADVHELFQQVSESLGDLTPREQAQFLPDSVIGSITIDVEGEQATFFYLVDAEQRQEQGVSISSKASEALEGLSRFSKKIRKQEE